MNASNQRFKVEQLDDFYRQGFLVLNKKFSRDMTEALSAEMSALLDDEEVIRNRINSNNGVQAHVISADLQKAANEKGKYKAFTAFMNDQDIPALIRGYLSRLYRDTDTGASIQAHEQIDLEINSRTGKTNNSDWHFDRVPSIKCGVFLCDVNARSGAFTAIPGSHFLTRTLALRHLTRNPDPMFIDNYISFDSTVDSICLEVSAGSVVLFDTMIIHKGGEITEEGVRRTFRAVTWPPVLNRAYFSATAPASYSIDKIRIETYHPFDRTNQRVQNPRHLFTG